MSYAEILLNNSQFTFRGDRQFASQSRTPRAEDQHDWDFPYAEWNWNGSRLEVKNDRYGLYPIFTCVRNNYVCVSNSLAEIVQRQDCAELNHEALAVFLRLGHFVGSDTAFNGIERLSANSHLLWDGTARNTCGAPSARVVESKGRSWALDEFIDRFRSAISGYARELHDLELVIPLSGGADSRHILLECARQKMDVSKTITIYTGSRNIEDVTIASELSSQLGIENVRLLPQQLQSSLAAEQEKNELCNFCTLDHAWYLAARQYLAPIDNVTVFDGLAGDVLSAGHRLSHENTVLLQEDQYEQLADNLLPDNEEFLRAILVPSFYALVDRRVANRRLRRVLESYRNLPNPSVRFTFENRTCLSISLQTVGLLDGAANVRHPFLQKDLFDFLISLPETLFFDKQFHMAAIENAYPSFRNVPYATKVPAVLDYPGNLATACSLIFHLFRSRSSRLLRTKRIGLSCFTKSCLGRNTQYYLRYLVYLTQLEKHVFHLRSPPQSNSELNTQPS